LVAIRSRHHHHRPPQAVSYCIPLNNKSHVLRLSPMRIRAAFRYFLAKVAPLEVRHGPALLARAFHRRAPKALQQSPIGSVILSQALSISRLYIRRSCSESGDISTTCQLPRFDERQLIRLDSTVRNFVDAIDMATVTSLEIVVAAVNPPHLLR
jgi:hypothetical protein